MLLAADIPFSAAVETLLIPTLLIPYLAYHELTDPAPRIRQAATEDRGKSGIGQADPIPQGTP